MVKSHKKTPFHRIQVWRVIGNQGAFEDTSLGALGLELHLGHGGAACRSQLARPPRVVHIVDVNGIHTLKTFFCGCNTAKPYGDLLFEHRLYPSPGQYPRVAFTFAVLKHFTTLQLETSCSAWGYFDALAQLTDAVNTKEVPVR